MSFSTLLHRLKSAFLDDGRRRIKRSGIEAQPLEDRLLLTAPFASDDSYSVVSGSGVYIDPSMGVLANDLDFDGDELYAGLVQPPAHGTVSLSSDGGFSYFAFPGYSGTDSFTYQVSDESESGNVASVFLAVVGSSGYGDGDGDGEIEWPDGENTAPEGIADSYSLSAGLTNIGAALGVLLNDYDQDGDAISAELITPPSFGSLVLNNNGAFTFDSVGASGQTFFTYRVFDGSLYSNATTVTLNIGPGVDADHAVEDSYAVESQSYDVELEVLFNDSEAGTISISSDPNHGTAYSGYGMRSGTDVVFYTPDSYSADQISYLNSWSTTTSEADVSIVVHAVDNTLSTARAVDLTSTAVVRGIVGDGPQAWSDVDLFAIDLQSGDEIRADVDAVEGDLGTGISNLDSRLRLFNASGIELATNDSGTDPDSGVFGLDPYLEFTATTGGIYYLGISDSYNTSYNPAFSGGGYSFGYGAYSIELSRVSSNNPPVAMNDEATVHQGSFVEIDVLANDSDPDGDSLSITDAGNADMGTTEIVSTDSGYRIRYTPDTGAVGADAFTYMITDSGGLSQFAEVSVLIENQAPVAVADHWSAVADTALSPSEGVLANDSDPDGDSLVVSLVAGPANGQLTISENGEFTYVPNAGFSGEDSFTYRASDGAQTSDAVVSLTVYPGSVVAFDDAWSVGHDTVLSVEDGVLVNDWDFDGDALTAEIVTNPSHGILSLNTTGTFTYSPTAGFTGADSFTYRATDGVNFSDIATVNLSVTNFAPFATDDTFELSHDRLLTTATAAIFQNDLDIEGDTLTATLVESTSDGTLTLAPTGEFSYLPNSGFVGTDSFRYSIDDGFNTGNTVTVNLLVGNWAPVSQADILLSAPNQVYEFTDTTLLSNDSDLDADTLTVEIVETTTAGTLQFSDGQFTYTPDAGFTGDDHFTYRAFDGIEYGEITDVSLKLSNIAPQATSDYYYISHDQTLDQSSHGVLANDTDEDGDEISATLLSGPSHGTLQIESDGTFVYQPDSDYVGEDHFTYEITDGLTASEPATAVINVTNEAPIVAADSFTLHHSTTLTVDSGQGVLESDSDLDGDILAATLVAGTSNGTLHLHPDGGFDYVPNSGFTGVDSFVYSASDGIVSSSDTTVLLTITNSLPQTNEDTFTVSHDRLLDIPAESGLLANDWDVDGDGLTSTLTASPAHGQVQLQPDGSFTFEPNEGFTGTDTFTYSVSDGAAQTAPITVTLHVTNSAPVASNRHFAAIHDRDFSVSAPGLFSFSGDKESDSLSIGTVSQPEHGSLTVGPDGSFVYIPMAGFVGADSFSYTLSDGLEESDPAIVTLEVFNSAPIASNDSYSITHGSTLFVDAGSGILANDVDLNNDPLSISILSQPEHGTLTLNSDGSFLFSPESGWFGEDVVTYRISDGASTAEASMTIDVSNSQPESLSEIYGVLPGESLIVSIAEGVLANDFDSDGDVLSAALVASPNNGILSLNAQGSFSYTPNANFIGVDTFAYRATDNAGLSGPTTYVSISTELIAVPDYVEASHDRTVASSVFANDFVAHEASFSAVLVEPVSSGTLQFNDNGDFTFNPDAGFTGTVKFSYQLQVGDVTSNTSQVTLEVVNNAPQALGGSSTVAHGRPVGINGDASLEDATVDRDGDSVEYQIVTPPSFGQLDLQPDGSFVYTPTDPAFTGTDSFEWVASDGLATSLPASYEIVVTNQPAIVGADTYSIHAGSELQIGVDQGLLANDYDSDEDALTVELIGAPLYGTVQISETGSFNYQPNPLHPNITDTFTYRAFDGVEYSETGTVSINTYNASPTSSTQKFYTTHSRTLELDDQSGLLSAVNDPDSDTLEVELVQTASHGSLTVSPGGAFSFTPDAGWTGTDTFRFRVSDGLQTSEEFVAEIVVTNNQTDVVDDWFLTGRNADLTFSTADFLRNDADPDLDSLQLSVHAGPANGTLSQNADGTYTYSPDAGYSGEDSFQYKVTDGAGESGIATVEIDIRNARPQVGNDRFGIDHSRGYSLTLGELLQNDFDANGDPLSLEVTAQTTHGTIAIENGILTYVPDPAFVGSDFFEYTVTDGDKVSGTALVTIDVRNSEPRIHEQYHRVQHSTSYQVDADSGLNYFVSDAESDPTTAEVVSQPQHGTLSVDAAGAWTYTPESGFSGKDSFVWRAFDGVAYSDPEVVTLEVSNIEVAATNDYFSVTDASLSQAAPGILQNDANLDSDALTVELLDGVTEGTLSLSNDGSFTYTPNTGYNGLDQFTYAVSDGVSRAIGTVRLQVGNTAAASSDPAPKSRNDFFDVVALGGLNVGSESGLLSNDLYSASADSPVVSLIAEPSNGTLTLSADGAFEYVPDTGATPFSGTDTFTYRLTDSTGRQSTATATINVENSAPWTSGAVVETQQGTVLESTGSVIASASGDRQQQSLSFEVTSQPANGVLSFDAGGQFTYTPNQGFAGLDSFGYRASDGVSDSNTSTITINVQNEAPSLESQSYRTSSGETLSVQGNGLLAGAIDSDGDPLSASVVQSTTNGSLTLNPDGTFEYTPNNGFSGRDTFTAKVSDGAGESSDVVFVVDVDNSLPVSQSSHSTTQHGQSTVVSMTAYDSDGNNLVHELVSAPVSGTLTYENVLNDGSNGQPIQFTGNVYYEPDAGFAGQDAVTFRSTDGVGFSEPAEVSLTVLNSAPIAQPGAEYTPAGSSLTVAAPGLLGKSIDADGDMLALELVSQPANGTVTLTTDSAGNPDGGYIYQPNPGHRGGDSFTWRVSDGVESSETATVDISVNNASPVVSGRTFQASYGAGTDAGNSRAYTFSLADNSAFDLEGDTLTYEIVSNGTNGAATITADGEIQYQPETVGFTGSDTITIRAFDGYSYSEPAEIGVSVSNQSPVASSDSFAIKHSTTLYFEAQDILGNDYDFDGDSLTVTSVETTGPGTITPEGNGWRYDPGTFVGQASLSYILSDGLASTDAVDIRVDVSNDITTGGTRSLQGTSNHAGWTTNNLDFELSNANGAIQNSDNDALTFNIVSQPSHGSLTLSSGGSTGTGRYVPADDFTGEDEFQFTISDGVSTSDPITYQVLITERPGYLPTNVVTVDDDGNSPRTSQFTSDATDADNVNLQPVGLSTVVSRTGRPGQAITGQLALGGAVIASIDGGTLDETSGTWIVQQGPHVLTVQSDGSYVLDAGSMTGTEIVQIQVDLTDANGNFPRAPIGASFTINNEAPSIGTVYAGGRVGGAIIDEFGGLSVPSPSPVSVDIARYAFDNDGDTYTFSGGSDDFTVTPEGVVTYSGDWDFGAVPSVTVTVTDQYGASSEAQVNIATIADVTYPEPEQPPEGQVDPPVAGDANFTYLDPDKSLGNVMSGSALRGPGPHTAELVSGANGTYGSIELSSSGTVKYLLNPGQEPEFLKEGQEPTKFDYKITNANGEFGLGTIQINATVLSNSGVSFGNNGVGVGIGSVAVAFQTSVADVLTVPLGGTGDAQILASPYSTFGWIGEANGMLEIDVPYGPAVVTPIAVSASHVALSAEVFDEPINVGGDLKYFHSGSRHPAINVGGDIYQARFVANAGNHGPITVGQTIHYLEISTNWGSYDHSISANAIDHLEIYSDFNGTISAGEALRVLDLNGDFTGAVTSGALGGNSSSFTKKGYSFAQEEIDPDAFNPESGVAVRGDAIGVFTSGGDLTEIGFEQSFVGMVTAGGEIGRVSIGGSATAMISAADQIGKVVAHDDFTGIITAGGRLGEVSVGGNLTGSVTGGDQVGRISAEGNVTGMFSAQGTLLELTAGRGAAGSINGTVQAEENIGSVVAVGGSFSGSATAGKGYIGKVTAGTSIQADITAEQHLGPISAGTFIDGTIKSEGAIDSVTASSGSISGSINAGSNIQIVSADAEVSSTIDAGGHLGSVTSLKAALSGEISAGSLGSAVAGTDVSGAINVDGNAGSVTAGDAAPGSIQAAITAGGNIGGVQAKAIPEGTILAVSSGSSLPETIDINTGLPARPARPTLNLPVYAGGNITASITAGGNVGSVSADGRIQSQLNAGGAVSSVTAIKNITGKIIAGAGGTSVSTHGALRADITVPGDTSVWAFDDITGAITVSAGSITGSTWGSFQAKKAQASSHVSVDAYGDVKGEITSDNGNANVRTHGAADIQLLAGLNAEVFSRLTAKGMVETINGSAFLSTAEEWQANVESAASAAITAVKAIKGRHNAAGSFHNTTPFVDVTVEASEIFIYAIEVTGEYTATDGPVVIQSGGISGARVTAKGGAVGILSYGDISTTRIKADHGVSIYASGQVSQTYGESLQGNLGVSGTFGVEGAFWAYNGGVTASSWDGIEGLYNGKSNVVVGGYGSLDGEIIAGKTANVSMWGDVTGSVDATNGVSVFAAGNVSSTLRSTSGSVGVISTGDVTGDITSLGLTTGNSPQSSSVSVYATGTVTAPTISSGGISVNGFSVSGEYLSYAGSTSLSAVDSVSGSVTGHTGVTVNGGSVSGEFTSSNGPVNISSNGQINGEVDFADGLLAVAGASISSLSGSGSGEAAIAALSNIGTASLTTTGSVFAFAGESANLTITSQSGGITAIGLGTITGSFAAAADVQITTFGSVSGVTAEGNTVNVFGLDEANATITGRTGASIESIGSVSGSLDADIAIAIAGRSSSATLDSRKNSVVVAGGSVSGSIRSAGGASAVSESRLSEGGGVSGTISGDTSATAVTLDGSVSGSVTSALGSATAFSGGSIDATIDGQDVSAVAIYSISGDITAKGTATVVSFGAVSSNVTVSEGSATVIAGDAVSGTVSAVGNATVASISNTVSGAVTSSQAGAAAIGMDGVSAPVSGASTAVAIGFGSVSGTVTATNGSALAASIAGSVSGSITAGENAAVFAFDSVSGQINAGKTVAVASLSNVGSQITAGESAGIIALGPVSGNVSVGQSAAIVSFGSIDSNVTADAGSVYLIAMDGITSSVTATETVAALSMGDVEISVSGTQDLITMGRAVKYKLPPDNSGDQQTAGAAAARDAVTVSRGSVEGDIQSGGDAIVVAAGTSTSNITAGGDAAIFALGSVTGDQAGSGVSVTAGGDAVVTTSGTGRVNLTGGRNAVLVTMDGASDSSVTGNEHAGILTLGAAENVVVSGVQGALGSSYGTFSGSVTASDGTAVVSTIGDIVNSVISGLDAAAVTVGQFQGSLTATDGIAAIISLLGASGAINAAEDVLIVADGTLNLSANASRDLVVWARESILGSYTAGRDAAAVAHGSFNASLTADNDIVFVYGRDGVSGNVTAGRNIGTGSSNDSNSSLIDDVFSHGDINAQLLAGTSASTDPAKGQIGSIGAVGNIGGNIVGSQVGSVRAGGTVTASISSLNSPQIHQGQSNLGDLIPLPDLAPSIRSEVLQSAADALQAARDDRSAVLTSLADIETELVAERQDFENQKSQDLADAREQASAIQQAADAAVDAAQLAAFGAISAARLAIEAQYLLQEDTYLKNRQALVDYLANARAAMQSMQQQSLDAHAELSRLITEKNTAASLAQGKAFSSSNDANQEFRQNFDRELKIRLLLIEQRGIQEANAKLVESIHSSLDMVGFIPGPIGIVADLTNAMVYYAEGRSGMAAFSLAATVLPFAGGKAFKMLRHADEGVDVASSALKTAENVASHAADDIIEVAPKGGGELLNAQEFEWVLIRNNSDNQQRLGKLYNAMLQDFKAMDGVIDPEKMRHLGWDESGELINGRYLYKDGVNEIELFRGRTFGTRMEELFHFEQVKKLRRMKFSDSEIESLIPRLEREARAKLEAWGFMRLTKE